MRRRLKRSASSRQRSCPVSGGEVVEHFVHAAVLALEDPIHQRGIDGPNPLRGPGRHAFEHVARLGVAGEHVHVEHAGHDLVQRVERRPRRLARAQAVEQLFRKCAQVAVAELRLALRQLCDERVAARFQRVVVGVRERQGARRKIVPGEMSAQLVVRRFPTAERLSRSGQARGHAKHVQQPVRVVGQQMPTIDVHCIERGSRPQPHLRQLERARDDPRSRRLREHHPRPVRERAGAQQRGVQECAAIEELSHGQRFRIMGAR